MENKKSDRKITVLTISLTCSVALNFGLGIISHSNANKAADAVDQIMIAEEKVSDVRQELASLKEVKQVEEAK